MTKTSLRSIIAIQDMNVSGNIGTRKALSDVVINSISITPTHPHLTPPNEIIDLKSMHTTYPEGKMMKI